MRFFSEISMAILITERHVYSTLLSIYIHEVCRLHRPLYNRLLFRKGCGKRVDVEVCIEEWRPARKMELRLIEDLLD